jgi:hypothetical protein
VEELDNVLLPSFSCERLSGLKSTGKVIESGSGSKDSKAIAGMGVAAAAEDRCILGATLRASANPVLGGLAPAEVTTIWALESLEVTVRNVRLAPVTAGVGHFKVVLAVVDSSAGIRRDIVLNGRSGLWIWASMI